MHRFCVDLGNVWTRELTAVLLSLMLGLGPRVQLLAPCPARVLVSGSIASIVGNLICLTTLFIYA